MWHSHLLKASRKSSAAFVPSESQLAAHNRFLEDQPLSFNYSWDLSTRAVFESFSSDDFSGYVRNGSMGHGITSCAEDVAEDVAGMLGIVSNLADEEDTSTLHSLYSI